MEAFRTRKETIKAAYTAAEAETRVREAVTGISEERRYLRVTAWSWRGPKGRSHYQPLPGTPSLPSG